MRHIIRTQDFTRDWIWQLFDATDAMVPLARKGRGTQAYSKIMASLFYAPSTRTRLSFEAAVQLLGGE